LEIETREEKKINLGKAWCGASNTIAKADVLSWRDVHVPIHFPYPFNPVFIFALVLNLPPEYLIVLKKPKFILFFKTKHQKLLLMLWDPHIKTIKINYKELSRWWSSGKSLGPRGLLPLWSQVRALWLLIWWPLEAYMVVNFRARGISRGARKLARTPTLN
jgi:hypothetical protein